MTKLNKVVRSLLAILFFSIISTNAYAYSDDGSINLVKYFGRLFFFLVIFIGIVFSALYFSKFIAKKTNYLAKGKHIRVLEAVSLNAAVRIVTVKIYKKVYIMSISSNHTTLIDTLDEEDIDRDFEDYLNENLDSNQMDLNDLLENVKVKIKKLRNSRKDKE